MVFLCAFWKAQNRQGLNHGGRCHVVHVFFLMSDIGVNGRYEYIVSRGFRLMTKSSEDGMIPCIMAPGCTIFMIYRYHSSQATGPTAKFGNGSETCTVLTSNHEQRYRAMQCTSILTYHRSWLTAFPMLSINPHMHASLVSPNHVNP